MYSTVMVLSILQNGSLIKSKFLKYLIGVLLNLRVIRFEFKACSLVLHLYERLAPHAGAAQDPVQAKLEHFYELPRNEQRAIVNHMTDIYVTHNPGVDREDAQAKVLHEILNPQRNQEPEYSHG
jgi:hypothetical protein